MATRTAFEYYQATNGEWRWRLKAGNGRIIADSGEGYSSEKKVRAACWHLQELVLFAGKPLDIRPAS